MAERQLVGPGLKPQKVVVGQKDLLAWKDLTINLNSIFVNVNYLKVLVYPLDCEIRFALQVR